MRDVQQRELEFYRTQNGREPFTEWFESINDIKTRTRIRRCLTRLELGNFSEVANTILLLLCGGDKSSQQRDIERAKTFWQGYKDTH